MIPTKFQVNWPFGSGVFKIASTMTILDWIGMILAIFDQVNPDVSY